MDMNDAKRYLNQAMHIMKSATSRVVDSAAQNRRVWMLGAGTTSALFGMYVYKKRRETRQNEPFVRADGAPKAFSTKMLEMGSKLMQSKAPLKGTNLYFVGFHPMHDDPCHQMEAHHYCKQLNEDFAQCVLFDGNTKNANMTGIEYIISEKLFQSLPPEESKYWHPHNYEILSGQLVAPGIPSPIENKVLKKMMNGYGKTFHTWRAKCFQGDTPFLDTLPKGPAVLAWSFNHEGEAKPEMILQNEKFMSSINRKKKRDKRAHLEKIAHPQQGINDLTAKFHRTSENAKINPFDRVEESGTKSVEHVQESIQ